MAKHINNAKFVVTLESNKNTHKLKTISIFDNRVNRDRTEDVHKDKPALKSFGDLADMKESLNWCLYCDDTKYRVKFGQGNKETQLVYAYLFD